MSLPLTMIMDAGSVIRYSHLAPHRSASNQQQQQQHPTGPRIFPRVFVTLRYRRSWAHCPSGNEWANHAKHTGISFFLIPWSTNCGSELVRIEYDDDEVVPAAAVPPRGSKAKRTVQ
uniref:(northern house mosquito) hypothetical protein n=1 Tax=Culex pipiens TaxID=7175 RepID=A0A8D8CP88_CULPI